MLTTDQKEALQEIANIGMGQAGASIARVLDEFVHLSVPRIVILSSEHMSAALKNNVGEGPVTVVRQAFHSQMRGEALVVFGEDRCRDLADLMGYEDQLDRAGEIEILLDITNLLVGACLAGIAEQLRATIGFSAPSLMADRVPVDQVLATEGLPWSTALLVEVNFRVDQRSFASQLLLLVPEDEIQAIAAALNDFLAAM
jgi:chemotaxis protein CheC